MLEYVAPFWLTSHTHTHAHTHTQYSHSAAATPHLGLPWAPAQRACSPGAAARRVARGGHDKNTTHRHQPHHTRRPAAQPATTHEAAMAAIESLAKNLTSGSSSSAFSRSLERIRSRQSSPTARPTLLQHLT